MLKAQTAEELHFLSILSTQVSRLPCRTAGELERSKCSSREIIQPLPVGFFLLCFCPLVHIRSYKTAVMLGVYIQFSVGWSFDHIFCCLLCTLVWHKQRNTRRTHTLTYGWSQLYGTTPTVPLKRTHTSAQTFTNLLKHCTPSPTQTGNTRIHQRICIHTHTHVWISCYIDIHWVWVTGDR